MKQKNKSATKKKRQWDSHKENKKEKKKNFIKLRQFKGLMKQHQTE